MRPSPPTFHERATALRGVTAVAHQCVAYRCPVAQETREDAPRRTPARPFWIRYDRAVAARHKRRRPGATAARLHSAEKLRDNAAPFSSGTSPTWRPHCPEDVKSGVCGFAITSIRQVVNRTFTGTTCSRTRSKKYSPNRLKIEQEVRGHESRSVKRKRAGISE